MNRTQACSDTMRWWLARVCGDEPLSNLNEGTIQMVYPRMRG